MRFWKGLQILGQLSQLRDFETQEQIEEADRLTTSCFSNLASCSIQQSKYVDAINWCNKALKCKVIIQLPFYIDFDRMNPENAKILLRRAKAYSFNSDYDEADKDLQDVEKLDDSLHAEVKELILRNKERRRAAMAKQKQQFRNFFDRS